MVERPIQDQASIESHQRVHFDFPSPVCEELLREYCELNHNNAKFDSTCDAYEFNFPLPAEIIFSLNGTIVDSQ